MVFHLIKFLRIMKTNDIDHHHNDFYPKHYIFYDNNMNLLYCSEKYIITQHYINHEIYCECSTVKML